MKPVLSALLLVGLLAASGRCDCSYFRTAANLQKCAIMDPRAFKTSDPYPSQADPLDLDESGPRSVVKVVCSCDYTLAGSDPRCDVDQSVERTSVLAAEISAHPCRRGTTLCRDVCPPRLP